MLDITVADFFQWIIKVASGGDVQEIVHVKHKFKIQLLMSAILITQKGIRK